MITEHKSMQRKIKRDLMNTKSETETQVDSYFFFSKSRMIISSANHMLSYTQVKYTVVQSLSKIHLHQPIKELF